MSAEFRLPLLLSNFIASFVLSTSIIHITFFYLYFTLQPLYSSPSYPFRWLIPLFLISHHAFFPFYHGHFCNANDWDENRKDWLDGRKWEEAVVILSSSEQKCWVKLMAVGSEGKHQDHDQIYDPYEIIIKKYWRIWRFKIIYLTLLKFQKVFAGSHPLYWTVNLFYHFCLSYSGIISCFHFYFDNIIERILIMETTLDEYQNITSIFYRKIIRIHPKKHELYEKYRQMV